MTIVLLNRKYTLCQFDNLDFLIKKTKQSSIKQGWCECTVVRGRSTFPQHFSIYLVMNPLYFNVLVTFAVCEYIQQWSHTDTCRNQSTIRSGFSKYSVYFWMGRAWQRENPNKRQSIIHLMLCDAKMHSQQGSPVKLVRTCCRGNRSSRLENAPRKIWNYSQDKEIDQRLLACIIHVCLLRIMLCFVLKYRNKAFCWKNYIK